MFTLKLKVLPRILLNGLLDQYMQTATRSLSELSKLLKLHDKIMFTAEEQALLNVRMEVNAESKRPEMHWNARAGGTVDGEVVDFDRDIELSDEQKEMLYTVFKDMDERKSFSHENAAVCLEIAEKLGYEIK